MDPPRAPTTEADLADWSVYADWLQTRGDPRGERDTFAIQTAATSAGRVECVFVARDVDAMLRSAHAGEPRR